MDVAGAFLNNEHPEEHQIRVRLPRLYQLLGICEEMDYVTTHSVYGRRTSPREWSSKRDRDIVNKVVFKVGNRTCVLKRTCSDPDAWLVKCGSKVVGIAMTYVDDFLLFTEDELLQPLIDALNACWTLGSIHKLIQGGDVKYCGFNLRWITSTKTGRDFYTLDQEDYVADLLRRRGMADANGAETPSVGDEDDPDEVVDASLVRQAQEQVGELIWISSRTRCDLAHAVSQAASILSTKPAAALRRCHRIHRYLRRTVSFRMMAVCGDDLNFQAPELDRAIRERLEFDDELWPSDPLSRLPHTIQVRGYGDASFCNSSSRSTTGVVVLLGTMAVAWRSRKQALISESSTEAEMVAQNETAAVGLAVVELVREVESSYAAATYVQRCDNRSTIGQIAGGQSWRTRSLSCRSRALRQKIMFEQIYLSHLAGKRIPADGLTKSLGKIDHQKFLNLTCLGPPNQDDRFDLLEDLSVLSSATMQLPEEQSARIASSSASSSSGTLSSNVFGDNERTALTKLIDLAMANGRNDVETQAKDLLLSLSFDRPLYKEEKEFLKVIDKIDTSKIPVAKVSVAESVQEFAFKSAISLATKALEGHIACVAKGAEPICVPNVCPVNEKEADEGMSKALIAVVAGVTGALTSFGVRECCRRRRRNVKKEKMEGQGMPNRADCYCPKNRQPVGFEIVPKISGEGCDIVPHFVNSPSVVSVGVQTNVMCKEGRFKETKGVPSTATRVMTKQELIEACQDDEIEDMEAPVPLSSSQSRSSFSSSSSSSSYTVSTVNRNG